jgi:hypothetical protein
MHRAPLCASEAAGIAESPAGMRVAMGKAPQGGRGARRHATGSVARVVRAIRGHRETRGGRTHAADAGRGTFPWEPPPLPPYVPHCICPAYIWLLSLLALTKIFKKNVVLYFGLARCSTLT